VLQVVARARFHSRSPVIAGIELWAMIAIGAAVLVGATLQGVVGLGLGLIVAPVTGLVAPQLLPGLALWLAMLLPLFTLTRDWRSADGRGLCWALAARMPGTAIGVWLVWGLPVRALHILVGVVVLVAVALTGRSVRLPTTPTTLLGAGFISGITGTVSSIGGPPLALVYQHHATDTLRATLGVYFVLGAAFSSASTAPTRHSRRCRLRSTPGTPAHLIPGAVWQRFCSDQGAPPRHVRSSTRSRRKRPTTSGLQSVAERHRLVFYDSHLQSQDNSGPRSPGGTPGSSS
jgi:uncharacterized protein